MIYTEGTNSPYRVKFAPPNGTEVSGQVAASTTWTKAASPYIVTGDVTVSSGTTLTIEPGTVVKFEPQKSLTVNGTLTAQGTASENIYFTSVKDDSVGGDTNEDGTATPPGVGDWGNIRFSGSASSGSRMAYGVVRYGGSGPGIYSNLSVSNSSAVGLDHVNVNNSASDGIRTDWFATPSITNSDIENNNGNGIYSSYLAQPSISNTQINSNGAYGAYFSFTSPLLFTNNTLQNNDYYGAYFIGSSSLPDVGSNTTSGNLKGGLAFFDATLSANNNWKNSVDSYILAGGSLSVGSSVTLTIDAGVIVKALAGGQMTVSGTLLGNGASGNPIYFTSYKDDTIGGDTNGDGSASSPSSGDWIGVTLTGSTSSGSSLSNVEFHYGGYTGGNLSVRDYSAATLDNITVANSKWYGLLVDQGAAPVIKNSTFSNNVYAGLYSITAAQPEIYDSAFSGNGTYGAYFNQSSTGVTIKGSTFISTGSGDGIVGSLTAHEIKGNTFINQSGQFDFDIDNTDTSTPNFPGNHGATIRTPIKTHNCTVIGGLQLSANFDLLESQVYGGDTASGWGNDPVNTSTGNFTYKHRDLKLPGKGMAIEFTRNYNSQDTIYDGTMGRGWTHNYNTNLRLDSDTTVTAMYADGRRVSFAASGGGDFTSPLGVLEKLYKNSETTYTLTFKNQTKYKFDGFGRMTAQIDKYGNSTGLSYNSNGFLAAVTDPAGRTLTITYNSDNRIDHIDDSASRTISFAYTGGNLTSFTDARGKTTTYTYNSDNRLESVKEPGAVKPIIRNYYTGNKVTSQLDALDSTFTFSYDTANRKTTLTDNRNNVSAHDWDERWRLTRATDPLSKFTQYAFGDLYSPLSVTDQNGWTTAFGYDGGGNTTGTIDPEGHKIQAGYDLTNNMLWSKDALNRQTSFNYDTSGTLLSSIVSPLGSSYFSYFSDGLLKSSTDTAGNVTGYEYNQYGNLSKITDALNSSTTLEYDSASRMTSLIDGENNKTRFGYDAIGNILNIKDPLSLLYPTERHQVDFGYDDRGNQTSFTDANNNLTSFIYNDMNNLTVVVDSLNSTTTYKYDPNYNLSSVSDALLRETNYGYDANNRLTSITDPLDKTLSYIYDGAGNVTETVYPNANKTFYQYYKDNLLKKISYNNSALTYDFTYNPTHTLDDVTDNSGKVWAFGYDAGDRLTNSSDQINSGYGTFIVGSSYDAVGNRTGLKVGSESTMTFNFNARYDLVSMFLDSTTTFEYDKARRRTKVTTQDDTQRKYAYDAASRVKEVTLDTASSDSTYTYTYDGNGNILSSSLRASGASAAISGYGYDALNRLTAWYNPDNNTTTTYEYDKVGNLLDVKEGTATVKSFTYNAGNQISSSGYAYDDNGSLTQQPAVSGQSPAKRFVYDEENRLKEVTNADTSQTIASYTYDFMGRRTSSTDSSNTTTYFHYDGWNVVAETDSSGTVTARYRYDDRGQLVSMRRGGHNYYYQFNAHGDVVSLTDSSGTVVNTYTYDPWGNPLTTSETLSNPYRYAGYRWDGESGLYYLNARHYVSQIARFLTKDPKPGYLGNPQSLNPYAYVENNPINAIDPSGETPMWIGIFVVLVVISLIWNYFVVPMLASIESADKKRKGHPWLDSWKLVVEGDKKYPSEPGGLERFRIVPPPRVPVVP